MLPGSSAGFTRDTSSVYAIRVYTLFWNSYHQESLVAVPTPVTMRSLILAPWPFISDPARGRKSSGVCRETVGAAPEDLRGVEQARQGTRRQCPHAGVCSSCGAACEGIAQAGYSL